MEGEMKGIVDVQNSIDPDDPKYLCGLSTVLVANIQELKDRISQIEFIFCSQLFPNFQSRSNMLEKRLVHTRKAAEEEWRKKESSLLNLIEELRAENQCAQEQIQQLNVLVEKGETRLMTSEACLKKHEDEKKQLLQRLKILDRKEETILALQEQLRQKNAENTKQKEVSEQLLQQSQLKDQQFAAEKKQRCMFDELNTNYKKLKSEYVYLLRKTGHTSENMSHSNRIEEEAGLPRLHLNKSSYQDCQQKDRGTIQLASKPIARNLDEKPEDAGDVGKHKKSNSDSCVRLSSSSPSLSPDVFSNNGKRKPIVDQKGASSSWRNTRVHQEQGGADPHDDFLDTPLEVFRNLNKGAGEEVQDIAAPAPKDLHFNNSDCEAQDSKDEPPVQQRSTFLPRSVKENFKFVEPVRKKAERENLIGVECKQCKKFYDAVLPDAGGKDLRCEHHDGISRHRYRYAPPMTPEGFWNIGFDSDI